MRDKSAPRKPQAKRRILILGDHPFVRQGLIALIETDLVNALERVASRADQLSMFELYFGEPERVNTLLDRLRDVTVEQIRVFAREHFGPDNRAVLAYEPSNGGDGS